MIYLEKDSSNIVILELTSVSTLISPYYTFELISEIDRNDVTYLTSEDLSTYRCRYNRFDIVEAGPTYSNPELGIVNLISGSYQYNIYESTIPTIIISETTGDIISTGKVIVEGEDTNIDPIYR